MGHTYNTEVFISKAQKIHGNKYDYTLTVYNGAHNKLKIICPLHGKFNQKANSHLTGSGCTKCNGGIQKTKQQFITDAITVHSNKYDYVNVEYSKGNLAVIITCRTHGDFMQTPESHLQGRGCPQCYNERRGQALFYSQSEFVDKASTVHENQYLYGKTVYTNSKTKIIVTCVKHGDFPITPNNHIQGYGCPKCSSSKGQKTIRLWFKNNQVRFFEEYTFPECLNPKTNRKLKFDFYLPDFNTCIEFDGEHHFKPVPFRGSSLARAQVSFIKMQYRDSLKEKFCNDIGIKLVRISFNQIDELQYILKEICND